jgi:hypothetical protein
VVTFLKIKITNPKKEILEVTFKRKFGSVSVLTAPENLNWTVTDKICGSLEQGRDKGRVSISREGTYHWRLG